MEKKSLGSFIALLRKEKGLTQKQLAELLNVSDKTVSHWECDETSPDISLLPLLAETLGVSVDELLKGEKSTSFRPFTEQTSAFKAEGFFEKAGNKISSFINKIQNGDITDRYRYFRILSLVGTVIAAVVLLSITLTTVLSVYFTASGMLASIVTLIGSLWTIVLSLGFTLGARFIFSKKLIPDAVDTPIEKDYIYKANRTSFNNLLLLFSAFPLALTGIDLLPVYLNLALALLFIFVARIACIVILTKKGIFRRNEKEMLLIRQGCICLLLLGIGAGIHLFAVEVYYPSADSIEFDNPEDFKSYMETPKEKPEESYLIDGVSVTMMVPTTIIDGDEAYIYEEVIDGDGSEVIKSDYSQEDVRTDTIISYKTGKPVVIFRILNENVYDYTYIEDSGIFTVITYEAKIKQKDILILLDDGLGILMSFYYIAVPLGCFLTYRRKAKQL